MPERARRGPRGDGHVPRPLELSLGHPNQAAGRRWNVPGQTQEVLTPMLFQRTATHVVWALRPTHRGNHGHLEAGGQDTGDGAASATAPSVLDRSQHPRHAEPDELRSRARTIIVRRAQGHHQSDTAAGPRVESAPYSTTHGDREPAAAGSSRSRGAGCDPVRRCATVRLTYSAQEGS